MRPIDADGLKTALISCRDLGRRSCEAVVKVIDEQPTIEAVPVVYAEWTRKRTVLHDGELYCTRCKCDSPKDEHWEFCPNCGAKMKGGAK